MICRNIIASGRTDLDRIQRIFELDCSEAERDRLFHYELVYTEGNKLWICLMEAITDVYREWISDVLEASDETKKDTFHKLHRDILDALKSGDMKRCEEAIEKHYSI